MKKSQLSLPVALTLMAGQTTAQQAAEWKMASAPLLTRWAKEVSPASVRPEYPRPLLVRKEWQSLNGFWQFAFDDANIGTKEGWITGKELPESILVPFTFEAALSGIGKGKEVHERVWYRRTFEVPPTWNGKRTLLHFGAVDWDTNVYVNGKLVGPHRGGYTPFFFDITEALKPQGPQEVVVAVYDPAYPDKGAYQPKGKQLGSEGIWYTRTTGIWQSVWLEPVASYHIERVHCQPTLPSDGKSATLLIRPQIAGHAAEVRETGVEVHLSYRGKRLASITVKVEPGELGTPTITLPVPDAQLWTPETPNLYDVEVILRQAGKVVDRVKSYTALRTVGIANGRLTLNGKPYFYRGVLDQGYWPDGILTPPTDAAIRDDVQKVKKLGFNMARKHVKVEDPRWYYWCDKLGVAVWQDMPSSHNLQSDEAKQNFLSEWTQVVQTVEDYPCVLHWIPFNENWGDPKEFQDSIVKLTRELEPTRPITDASGWTQRSLTDVIDAHDYGNNLLAHGVEHPDKPKVVGEYGGIALPIPGHTWTTGWGYQTARDAKSLIQRIRYQTSQLFDAINLSGYVYTQLTDVEQELNGVMTYDRRLKAPLKDYAAVFEGRDRIKVTRQNYLRNWLVLGPVPAGTALNSGSDNEENRKVMADILARDYLPAEAALNPAKDSVLSLAGIDYSWKETTFDNDALDFHRVFGGETQNAVAYAVATVEVPHEIKNVSLLFGSDDGAKVWLNGKPIWTVARIRGVSPDADTVPGLTLKAGRNVLVVKVGQGIGGWGLSARFELPDGSSLVAMHQE